VGLLALGWVLVLQPSSLLCWGVVGAVVGGGGGGMPREQIRGSS